MYGPSHQLTFFVDLLLFYVVSPNENESLLWNSDVTYPRKVYISHFSPAVPAVRSHRARVVFAGGRRDVTWSLEFRIPPLESDLAFLGRIPCIPSTE